MSRPSWLLDAQERQRMGEGAILDKYLKIPLQNGAMFTALNSCKASANRED